ncbi:MAG: PEP/pyruvate-binding domain-containing protein [bacterium]|nr:PEP/pyruvate-binding domain-containing protein [bacterium]
MPEYILHKDQEWALATAGGKGASLQRLLRAGFKVPPFFCISTAAYDRFMAENGIKELTASINPEEAGTAIGNKILNSPFPAAIHDGISLGLAGLAKQVPAERFLAVRSSATCEDLPKHSFAGQHDSFLGVTTESGVLEAVKKCWASLWSVRAAAYRQAGGIDGAGAGMAVLVQLMVKAQSAGVIFTADPVSGRTDQMLVNAAKGLGDKLVSGLISPDEYSIDKTDGRITQRLSGKASVLSGEQIKELAALARQIEALFSAPQDIEWAYDGKQFWILQSRPITAVSSPPAMPDVQWGNPVNQKLAQGRVIFWSNWNTRENMAYPLKPLAWSFFNDLLVPVIGDVLYGAKPGSVLSQYSQFVDLVNGRAYWNMSMLAGHPIAGRMIMPHLDKLDQEAATAFSELQKRGEFVPVKIPLPRHQLILPLIKGFVTFISFPWLASPRWIEKRCQRFLVQVRDYVELPLEKMSTEQMLDEARRYGDIIARFAFPLLVVASKSLVGLWVIDRLIKKWPDLKSGGLLAGIPGNKTTETALELYKISLAPEEVKKCFARSEFVTIQDVHRVRRELDQSQAGREFLKKTAAFLEEYGHRGSKDLDAGHPSWKEDPTYIFAMLKGYMGLGPEDHNPLEQFQRAVAGRLVLEAEIRSRLSPFKRRVFDWALKMVHDFLPWRENEKFYGVKVFPGSRRIIAEIGRRYLQAGLIAEPEDIFFLTIPEIEQQERGRALDAAQMSELITGRKARWQKQTDSPGEFIIRSDGIRVFGLTTPAKEGKILKGVAASGGLVTGIARIIRDPLQAHRFRKGEILVAPFTEPGWAPLFLLSKALVMEVGGSICHGAIVAREYGIPAVVGAKGATKMIKDGDMITVDGDAGTVTKID